MRDSPHLKRSLTLSLTTFYGLGTILGAGIYVLIGKVAGLAGQYTALSFLVALILASFSAFSYAELSSRFPKSSGEAYFIQKGFGLNSLTTLTGLLITFAGIVSAATLTRGFLGYLQKLMPVSEFWVIPLVFIFLGFITFWGIQESVVLATVITIVEVTGLLMIVWVSREHFQNMGPKLSELFSAQALDASSGILLGSFVAFYAFIGFEDMVNVAEEVKNPKKNMPRAILIALVVSTFVYMLVSFTATLVLSPNELNQSSAPLADIFTKQTGQSALIITLISLFAVINGALTQFIKSSRVIYGMAQEKWLPSFLGTLHPKRQTPLRATIAVTLIAILFTLFFPVLSLAQFTSTFTLMIFVIMNVALVRIKLSEPATPDTWTVPLAVPLLGSVLSLGFLIYQAFNIS